MNAATASLTIRKGFIPNCGPNNSGFTTYVAHVDATCGKGKVVTGLAEGRFSYCPTCTVTKKANVEGPFGGSDGHVTLQQVGPDAYKVSAYCSVGDTDIPTATLIGLDAARAYANASFKAIKAARTDLEAARAARRAAR